MLFLKQLDKQFSTYVIIVIVAFTQGVLGLADLAINYLYKDDFKMHPSQVSVVAGITSLPWIIKPIWGAITDSVWLFGYRRKSYLIIFGILQCMCWLALSSKYIHNPWQGIAILFIKELSVAFLNVIAEALLVEISRDQKVESDKQKQVNASRNVSLFFSIRSLGVLLTAYTGGILLEYLSKKKIFMITAIFPFILTLASFSLPEKYKSYLNDQEEPSYVVDEEKEPLRKKKVQIQQQTPPKKSNLQKVFDFVSKKEILLPISFIFIFMATPNTGSSMFYFYTNKLGFQPEFMGELKLVHALANIIGIQIYHRYFKLVPFKKVFIVSAILTTMAGLSQILLVTRKNVKMGIPDTLFCIGDSLIIQTFAEINTIPLLVFACRICPKNIEGTMYALIMSTLNFGGLLSYQLGGLLIYYLNITEKHFDNLWLLILIANVTTILPLPFIVGINFEQASQYADKHKEIESNKSVSNKNKNFNNYEKFFRESILALRKRSKYLNFSQMDHENDPIKAKRRQSM